MITQILYAEASLQCFQGPTDGIDGLGVVLVSLLEVGSFLFLRCSCFRHRRGFDKHLKHVKRAVTDALKGVRKAFDEAFKSLPQTCETKP